MQVRIEKMRLTRIQVMNVRAIFDTYVGPIRLVDCCLMGTLADDPVTMKVGLPGRRKERGGNWQTLVFVDDPVLLAQINELARQEYQRQIDPKIERLIDRKMLMPDVA